MEIRLRLVGGDALDIDADPDALDDAFGHAVRSGRPLDLRGAAGRVLAVNPAHILWWELAPWETEEPRVRPLRAAAGGQ